MTYRLWRYRLDCADSFLPHTPYGDCRASCAWRAGGSASGGMRPVPIGGDASPYLCYCYRDSAFIQRAWQATSLRTQHCAAFACRACQHDIPPSPPYHTQHHSALATPAINMYSINLPLLYGWVTTNMPGQEGQLTPNSTRINCRRTPHSPVKAELLSVLSYTTLLLTACCTKQHTPSDACYCFFAASTLPAYLYPHSAISLLTTLLLAPAPQRLLLPAPSPSHLLQAGVRLPLWQFGYVTGRQHPHMHLCPSLPPSCCPHTHRAGRHCEQTLTFEAVVSDARFTFHVTRIYSLAGAISYPAAFQQHRAALALKRDLPPPPA